MRIIGLVIAWSLLSAAFVVFVRYAFLLAKFQPSHAGGAADMGNFVGVFYLIYLGAASAVGIVSAVAIFFLSRKT